MNQKPIGLIVGEARQHESYLVPRLLGQVHIGDGFKMQAPLCYGSNRMNTNL